MTNTTLKPDYPLPTIHLNGNSKESLLSGYLESREKFREFKKRLRAIDFHSRNYYIQDAEWFGHPIAYGETAFAKAADDDHAAHIEAQ